MDKKNVKLLKYHNFCSRCQERTGPFYYEVIDEINPSESGTYEFFGNVVKPDFIMINNSRFNTRKGYKIRDKLNYDLLGRIMYINTLKISIDNTNYRWNHNDQIAECLVLDFTFNNDESGNPIQPLKLIFGNDTKLELTAGEKFLIDEHRIKVNGITYGFNLPSSETVEGEPPLLTDELLNQIKKENNSSNRHRLI